MLLLGFKKTIKIFKPLDFKQKSAFLYLFLLSFLTMSLEVLSVGLVAPVLSIIISSDFFDTYPVVAYLFESVNLEKKNEVVVIVVMLVFLSIYFLKTLFVLYFLWVKEKFSENLSVFFSDRLLSKYLGEGYLFHLKMNSSVLIRSVGADAKSYVKAITALLGLIADTLVFFGLVALLIWTNPIGALLILLLLGGFGISFYFASKKKIHSWGERSLYHRGKVIQFLQESFNGIKDIKVSNREIFFRERYNKHNRKLARIGRLNNYISLVPRILIEILVVAFLVVVIVYMAVQEKDLSTLIPTIGVFSVAAFRLMPVVSKILASVQALKYLYPTFLSIYDRLIGLGDVRFNSKDAVIKKPIFKSLSIENLYFRYPDETNNTLKNISLTIDAGSSIGLIGSSGAGKSTLLDVILGILPPSNGKVVLNDSEREIPSKGGLYRYFGYIPQKIYITDDSICQNIAFGIPKKEIDEYRVRESIKLAQLEAYVSSLEYGLDTVLGENGAYLSGGQIQRIGIARALYHDPPILVLDEATSALDIDTEAEVMKAITSLKGDKTIIIVAHRLSTLENCDYLYRIKEGKIVAEGISLDA